MHLDAATGGVTLATVEYFGRPGSPRETDTDPLRLACAPPPPDIVTPAAMPPSTMTAAAAIEAMITMTHGGGGGRRLPPPPPKNRPVDPRGRRPTAALGPLREPRARARPRFSQSGPVKRRWPAPRSREMNAFALLFGLLARSLAMPRAMSGASLASTRSSGQRSAHMLAPAAPPGPPRTAALTRKALEEHPPVAAYTSLAGVGRIALPPLRRQVRRRSDGLHLLGGQRCHPETSLA